MNKISINQEDCLGCSLCGNELPEVFEVDQNDFKCKIRKNGKLSESEKVELSDEQIEKMKEAISNCPVNAIKMEDEQ